MKGVEYLYYSHSSLMSASAVTLASAVEAFFADKDLARNSRRTYHQMLDAFIEDHTPELPVASISPAKVRRTIEARWGDAAPSTWNSRMTALQSFKRYCDRNGWIKRDPLKGIDRKREPRDETKAIAYDVLDALWSRPDVGLGEKTLW